MTDQMDSKPTPPAGGEAEEGEFKFCKVCGEELTETNHSKDKEGVCLDCEGMGDDAIQDDADSTGAL
jgi:hypothetical protein